MDASASLERKASEYDARDRERQDLYVMKLSGCFRPDMTCFRHITISYRLPIQFTYTVCTKIMRESLSYTIVINMDSEAIVISIYRFRRGV